MFEKYFYENQEDHDNAELTKKNVVDTTERMGMILDLLPVGFMIHQQQSLLFANQVAIDNLALSEENYIGQHFLDFTLESDFDCLNKSMKAAFTTDEIQKVKNLIIPNNKGNIRCYQIIMARLPWRGIPCIQIFMQDDTEAKMRENELKKLSSTDYLTGARNRRSFISYADKIKTEFEDVDFQHGLIVFDIDHFKAVNDTYGHEAGDDALIKIVQTSNFVIDNFNARRDVTHAAALARIGGEEFAIIIPMCKSNDLNELAENLREKIEQMRIQSQSINFKLTSSFGISLLNNDQACIDTSLRDADCALYEAKKTGRNLVVWSQSDYPTPPKGQRISRQLKR